MHSLRQLLRYRFDNFMARGGRSIFISLVIVFVSLLTLIASMRAIALAFVGVDPERGGGIVHNWYITFLQMTDPGNMAQDIESSPYYKIFAILAGLVGVVMLSSLIAFITNALDQKLGELKKGHSKVIEDGHTLILGWNERVVEILRELIMANESEDDPCVVILSSEDKEWMDDYIKVHLSNSLNTRIVTRSGTVSSLVNLDIVSVQTAKSVIVLANCNVSGAFEDKLASDTMVIKTILAVHASKQKGVDLNMVAEVFSHRNREIVESIAPGEVITVDTNDILAKMLVQTSRSVGLSVVYSEVLSFDGCEMYFHHDEWGELSFGELSFHFPDGVPMGIRHADGSLEVNPPAGKIMAPDDHILILAEDDSTIEYRAQAVAAPQDIPLAGGRLEQMVERELIIGWTPKVEVILEQYSDYVKEGSRVDIMLRAPDDQVTSEIQRIQANLPKLEIHLFTEDPLQTEGLLAVRPFEYDNIIILSQSGKLDDPERTDSETIVILLLLRNIFDALPADERRRTKLITEVLDSENQALVARTGVQDFIISNRYISMLLAQISEDADIKRVYDDLFQEDGSEIYLKQATVYFESLPVEVTFADMMRITQKRGEVCLGVKIKELEREIQQNFGVQLIPEKNQSFVLQPEDTLVVLAEDEM